MKFNGEQDDGEFGPYAPQNGPGDSGGSSFAGGVPSSNGTPQIGVNTYSISGETPRERQEIQSTPGANVGNYGGERDDSANTGGGGGNNYTSTPRKPDVPTPMSGQQSTLSQGVSKVGLSAPTMTNTSQPSTDDASSQPPTGVIPFDPLPSGPIGTPAGGSSALFGSVGGLKSGGLGVPAFSGHPDNMGIDQLIQGLMKRQKGLF